MNLFDIDGLDVLATVWTIRAALACLVGTFILLSQLPTRSENPESKSSIVLEGAKHLWVLGSFFSFLHALAAMIFYHDGSHELAMADTARQTKELLGVSVEVGFYFNYVFVGLWLADAMWWTSKPVSYESRQKFVTWAIYGFIGFIAINGAIVFESGMVRWISLTAVVVLILLCLRKRTQENTYSEANRNES